MFCDDDWSWWEKALVVIGTVTAAAGAVKAVAEAVEAIRDARQARRVELVVEDEEDDE